MSEVFETILTSLPIPPHSRRSQQKHPIAIWWIRKQISVEDSPSTEYAVTLRLIGNRLKGFSCKTHTGFPNLIPDEEVEADITDIDSFDFLIECVTEWLSNGVQLPDGFTVH